MLNSIHLVHQHIFTTHLEELAYLYEQRQFQWHDAECHWLDQAEIEQRMFPHLQALAVGAQPAFEVATAQYCDDEVGILYACFALACHTQQLEWVLAQLQALPDTLSDECLIAISDALIHYIPDAWYPIFKARLVPNPLRLYARLWHYNQPMDVLGLIQKAHALMDQATATQLLRMTRLQAPQHGDALLKALPTPLPHDCLLEYHLTQLMPDPQATLAQCMQSLSQAPELAWVIALSGHSAAQHALIDYATHTPHPDIILSIGLSGHIAALPVLFDTLQNVALAPIAAQALYLITGAVLKGDAFTQEEWQEDELFDDELEAFQQTGQVPLHPSGEAYGQWIEAWCTQPSLWQTWLNQHRTQFSQGTRFRLGKPFGPLSLCESLLSIHLTTTLRDYTYQQLAIEYQCPIAFQADQLVKVQRAQLNALYAWCQPTESLC